MFKDWKTTLSGIAAALPQLLSLFGVPIPAPAATALSTIGLFLIGLFAKDGTGPTP